LQNNSDLQPLGRGNGNGLGDMFSVREELDMQIILTRILCFEAYRVK